MACPPKVYGQPYADWKKVHQKKASQDGGHFLFQRAVSVSPAGLCRSYVGRWDRCPEKDAQWLEELELIGHGRMVHGVRRWS